MIFDHILIIADIEGTTGCWSYDDSRFMTKGWPGACLGMTLDVASVVEALFEAGVRTIRIKDFHRTGYNLLPEYIDPRAEIVHGYIRGPVLGLGDPGPARAVMFVGLHAASGTHGFLAHTLTSRIASLTVNGAPVTEAEFFSASLAPHNIAPIFFSGDESACAQAAAVLPGLQTFSLNKTGGSGNVDASAWRQGLAEAAVKALSNSETRPHRPQGPFRAEVVMRDGEKEAEKIAKRWRLNRNGPTLIMESDDFLDLYYQLARLAYLTPLTEKIIPIGLGLYNILGLFGLQWVRWKLKSDTARTI